MIILVTGEFDIYDKDGTPTGKKEFVVSHGVNLKTGEIITMPQVPPLEIEGAYYDSEIDELVLD
jgi:hypothetical protein